MRTSMHVLAALGMLGAAAAGARADDKDFRFQISIGTGFPWGVAHCEPDPCRVVRYCDREVWETVPRCEVWYDACGHRHERTVYVRVCRTVRVPVYGCGHSHHDDHGYWRGHGRYGRGDNDWRGRDDHDRPHGGRGDQQAWRGDGGRDDRDYPQTRGLDGRGEGRASAGSTKEVKPQDRVPVTEPARAAALPSKDARASVPTLPTRDTRGAKTDAAKGKAEPARGRRLVQSSPRKP